MVMSFPQGGSVGISLPGKRTNMDDHPCFWKLQPGTGVHDIDELSVCALVRLKHRRPWTGFVYKAPGAEKFELGLQGTSSNLDVWLLGKKVRVETKLELHQWYSICITWSSRAHRLHVYINGINQRRISPGPSQTRPLASNGTLTLGVFHELGAGTQVMMEDGSELVSAIGQFRMWNRERTPEEMSGRICAGGDALNWDAEKWRYGCSPQPDQRFGCGKRRVAQDGFIVWFQGASNSFTRSQIIHTVTHQMAFL